MIDCDEDLSLDEMIFLRNLVIEICRVFSENPSLDKHEQPMNLENKSLLKKTRETFENIGFSVFFIQDTIFVRLQKEY